jgi:oligo-1,6-glucosidase
MMEKTWWKEGIMYQIYPRSFKDSNGDGIGDIGGIIEKLDYLKALGVDIIWLGPVYPSPNEDNGYDVADYCGIHPEFGNMKQFDEMLAGLHQRDIKLIMDLVPNHSSDEHVWFQESKKSKDNPFRDYYYWRPGKRGGPPNNWKSWFSGSVWKYDENTEEFYLHLFSKKQPDLNWENQELRFAMYDNMKFWLDKGVDGFRIDVVSLISKHLNFPDSELKDFRKTVCKYYANGPRVHEFLQEMNREVFQHYDMMTVGEGPGITKALAPLYIKNSRKELNMIFQLELMEINHGPGGKFDFLPISLLDIKKVFREWNDAVGEEGWNNVFLDNHDFPRMLSRFGNDTEYRNESAKLLATLLLSLRGTPCIYQGSEIGMRNVKFDSISDYKDLETINYYKEEKAKGRTEAELLPGIYEQGRDNVRTPLQWDDSENAGFTSGTSWIKVNRDYKEINIASAMEDENSIFFYYQKMIVFRKSHECLVYGTQEEYLSNHPSLYVILRATAREECLVVLNFSDLIQDFPTSISKKAKIWIFGNYSQEENIHAQLRPWEARIYKTS